MSDLIAFIVLSLSILMILVASYATASRSNVKKDFFSRSKIKKNNIKEQFEEIKNKKDKNFEKILILSKDRYSQEEEKALLKITKLINKDAKIKLVDFEKDENIENPVLINVDNKTKQEIGSHIKIKTNSIEQTMNEYVNNSKADLIVSKYIPSGRKNSIISQENKSLIQNSSCKVALFKGKSFNRQTIDKVSVLANKDGFFVPEIMTIQSGFNDTKIKLVQSVPANLSKIERNVILNLHNKVQNILNLNIKSIIKNGGFNSIISELVGSNLIITSVKNRKGSIEGSIKTDVIARVDEKCLIFVNNYKSEIFYD